MSGKVSRLRGLGCCCLLRVNVAASVAEFSEIAERIEQQEYFRYSEDVEGHACNCLYYKIKGGEGDHKEKAVEPEAYLPSFAVI